LAGSNITLTPVGQTITINSTSVFSGVIADSPLSGAGTSASHLTIDLSSRVPYTGATQDVRGDDWVSLRGATLTRDGSNLISTIQRTGGRLITITRSSGIIQSWTDSLNTWTLSRSGGFISGVTVT
jgi:hypothetical protein